MFLENKYGHFHKLFGKEKYIVNIVRVTHVTDELISAFERLIPQLGPGAQMPTSSELIQITESLTTFLFVARYSDSDNKIVGTSTLVIYRTPTGLHARMEDVVVDENMRGKGIGEALSKAVLRQANELDVKSIDLTSRPLRDEANHLYQKLGFIKRDTNTYRYIFPRD